MAKSFACRLHSCSISDSLIRIFRAIDRVLQVLQSQGQARELGEVCHEVGYRVGPNWLIPDVSISHAGQTEDKYLEGAPALAIEVISKSNPAEMMQRKVMLYMEYQGREAWLCYPRNKSVVVYRGRTAVEVQGTLTSDILPGLSIDLAEVFAGREQR